MSVVDQSTDTGELGGDAEAVLDQLPRRREPAAVLALALYWVLVVSVVASLVGMGLAVAGLFHPALVVVLGVAGSIVLGMAAWQPYRDAVEEHVRGGILPVLAVCLVIAGSAASAAFFSGEHLRTDRDPAIYLTTGRWLADEGTLVVSGKVGGFDGVDGITAETPGYYEAGEDGTLDAQFLHLLPVWAAMAHWVGGDQALLRINAVAMAIALGALWLLASTMVGAWPAALATASVAVMLPTVHFARDLYSEPLSLFFVFAGLAMLEFARRAGRPALSLLAGLLVGSVTLTRIDGWLVVIAAAAYLTVLWVWAQQTRNQPLAAGFVQPAIVGMLVSGSVGLLDGLVRSRPYLLEHSSQVVPMFGALIAVMAGGLIALRLPGPVRRMAGWLAGHRTTLAWLVPTLVIAAAVVAFARPYVQEMHWANPDPSVEILQRREGLTVDPTRSYFEMPMHWLSWYLGIPALALGVLGVALGWRRAIGGRRELWAFLVVLSLSAGLYITRPSITPDQLFAIRRFFPVVLPGLVVAAALVVQWGVDRFGGRAASRTVLVAAALAMVVVPATVTWPLGTATSYVGMYQGVEDVCNAAPEGSAVLLTTQVAGRIGPSIRSFCGIPVAGIPDPDSDPSCVISAANRAWDERGVNLLVGYRDELDVLPSLRVDVVYEMPEYALSHAPATLIEGEFSMNLVDADAVDSSSCSGA